MAETESIPPISVMQHGRVRVVDFTQNKILDPAEIAEIEQTLMALLEEEANPRLVLDFSNVDNLSSAALGMLVNVKKRVAQENGILKLANIKPHLFQVFEITNLNKQFDVRSTVEEAISAMSPGFTSG